MNEGDIVVHILDKSKNTIIMPMDMYLLCSTEHTNKGSERNWDQVKRVEREANNISKHVVKMFQLGSDDGNKERLETAVKVVDSHPLQTIYNVKDHKALSPTSKLPKTKPVCNASDGLWLDPIADKEHSKAESRSTENLRSGIDETYKVPVDKNKQKIVMSLGVLLKQLITTVKWLLTNLNSRISMGVIKLSCKPNFSWIGCI